MQAIRFFDEITRQETVNGNTTSKAVEFGPQQAAAVLRSLLEYADDLTHPVAMQAMYAAAHLRAYAASQGMDIENLEQQGEDVPGGAIVIRLTETRNDKPTVRGDNRRTRRMRERALFL